MLPWFDLLPLCARHTRTYAAVAIGTKARAQSAAAAVPLLLYCCCIILLYTAFVAAWLSTCYKKKTLLFLIVLCAYDSTHPTHIYTETHTHTY